MDITFLIGNGFDISMGYKVSYKDFCQWYVAQDDPEENADAIRKLKNDISSDIKSGLKNWSDFEIAFGRFSQNFSANSWDSYIACYGDVLKSLNKYLHLKVDEKKIPYFPEDVLKELRHNLVSFYQEGTDRTMRDFVKLFKMIKLRGDDVVFNFLSFNYTDVLDRCLMLLASQQLDAWTVNGGINKVYAKPDVIHIHNLLDNYPIVGVGADSQLANEVFRKIEDITSLVVKPRAVDTLESDTYRLASQVLNRSQVICLWGTSIGSSDAYWWSMIATWLKSTVNYLCIFCYDDGPQDTLSVKAFRDKREKILQGFFQGTDISPAVMKEMKRRIYIIFNTEHVLTFLQTLKKYTEKVLPDKADSFPASARPTYRRGAGLRFDVGELLQTIGETPHSLIEIMSTLKFPTNRRFLVNCLNRAIAQGFVSRLYPDNPHHPLQKYLLTVKGTQAYQSLNKKS